jgi:MFS family permease
MARVTMAFALFVICEYAAWIGMLVYAYQQGGATASGLVAVAQLVPGMLLAPLVANVADRRSPTALLTAGYVLQAASMAGVAVALMTGAPSVVVYGFAIVATTAMAAIRPAQYTLLPAMARDTQELTAANVVASWVESGGIVLGAVLAAVFLGARHIDFLFVITTALEVACVLLVAPLAVSGIAVDGEGGGEGRGPAWLDGLSTAAHNPRARLLVLIFSAQFVVEGALDVLLVVIALDVLDKGPGWVGLLNIAYGIGGVVAGLLAAQLMWRRLGRVIAASAVILGVSLGLTAFSNSGTVTLVLLGVVGAGRALLSVSVTTVLQRVVPAAVVGRVFGLVEGFSDGGLAAGAALAPLLIKLGGYRLALLSVACLLPLLVVAGTETLRRLDEGATVPIVEIALLRSLPHFSELPASVLETLAEAVQRIKAAAGEVIIRQGEEGDRFYAIVAGTVAASVDGERRRYLGRGQGFGEIALLRRTPRTATITAVEPVSLLALESSTFLAALSGHAPTRRRVNNVATGWGPEQNGETY